MGPTLVTAPTCAGTSDPESIPLGVPGTWIAQFERLTLPAGVPLHHISSAADLPTRGHGGDSARDYASYDALMHLLFPDGIPDVGPGRGDPGESDELPVIGFDVEWRPQGRRYGYSTSSRNTELGGPAVKTPDVPVAVLQLSSEHANVVINVTALGRSVLGRAGAAERAACAAGVACARAVFECAAVRKVGLQCAEDVRRLRQVMPECDFQNVVDIKVRSATRRLHLFACFVLLPSCFGTQR